MCVRVCKCVAVTSVPGVKTAQTSCQGKHHVRSFDCQMNGRSSRQAVSGWFGSGVRVRVLSFDTRKPDESCNHVKGH